MSIGPLSAACLTRDPAKVALVLQQQVKPDEQTLNFAIESGNVQIVELVVRAGAPAAVDSLSRACLTSNEQIFDWAILAGARPASDSLTQAFKSKNLTLTHKLCHLRPLADAETLDAAIEASAGFEWIARSLNEKSIFISPKTLTTACSLRLVDEGTSDPSSPPTYRSQVIEKVIEHGARADGNTFQKYVENSAYNWKKPFPDGKRVQWIQGWDLHQTNRLIGAGVTKEQILRVVHAKGKLWYAENLKRNISDAGLNKEIEESFSMKPLNNAPQDPAKTNDECCVS